MAEKNKPLSKIAENLSPGVATAAAQAKLTPAEQAQLAAFGELKKTHQFLASLPQNDAYKNYKNLTPEYQDALRTYFSPKYSIQDKGFLGNIARSVASSAHYAVQTFKELGMQIAGLPIKPETSVNPAQALLGLGTAPVTATVSEATPEPVKKGTGKVLEALVRSQEKIIKQPYAAERLAEEEGEGGLLSYAKFLGQGLKELAPGGEDATAQDNSTTWKKYWEQASDKENVFDKSEVAKIESSITPDAAFVGKMLAGKKNFIDNYEEILKNPQALDLIQRYTSGDKEAARIVGEAVSMYERAKISPGRDVARALVSAFPFEADAARNGSLAEKAFFNTVSGGIDFAVTFGLDPLILIGKAKRTADIARFGLIKMGEDPRNLEKAFKNASVRRYWDELGKVFVAYNKGDTVQKGAALTRIQERFPEINLDVAQYMAPNIKDADTALEFFRGGDIIDDISRGNAGLRRDPLIPRYTQARYAKDWLRDGALKGLEKVAGKYEAISLPGNVDDIARFADEDPISWSEKIGYKEITTPTGIRSLFAGTGKTVKGVKTEGKFVSKDASVAAKIDRVMRQFSIAPSQERIISISDASSATQVYRLMRTVVDKGTASTFRAAWIAANEGQRLLMYKGLTKTLAYGMGLDHSVAGREFIASIDETAQELYSVNQSVLDLGEWSRVLGTLNVGRLPAPEGVRKIVAEATDQAQSDGKAMRVLASSGQEMAVITQQINELKALKKELIAKAPVSPEEASAIKDIVSDIDNSLKILGGTMGKMRVARKDIKKYIDDLDPADVDSFNAAELNGAQRGVRAYQTSQSRYMPNLVDLRKFELRGNVFSAITGKVGESVVNQKVTDIWSYLNLYPRLGIRTSVEEVGTAALIGGTEGIANYFKGFAMSQEIRKASAPTLKISAARQIEKEVSPLGIISRTLYNITRKNYSKQEILAMADNPEELAQAIGKSLLKDRFKPEFLQTAKGKRAAGYAEDWVTNGGNTIMQEINGAVRQAEFKEDVAESTANYLRQYGPSVALNPDITKALKEVKFSTVYGEIAYNRTDFLLNWYLDLHNTIGKRNIFGQIVFSNIYRKEEDAIEAVAQYLDGKGNELAKKFAIYNSEGSYEFARRIYADATNALRDYSGRLNKNLIEEIKASGGIDNFDFKQLHKYNENFQMPKTVLGRELVPLEAGDSIGFFDRVMKNGYAWVGKQISILDREPITYGNYIMYRDDLMKYESNFKKGLLDAGIDDAVADKLARSQSHEVAINLARQRTLGYVDNSDIRTNLAFNLRNFGRYYRATEDFYRRLARLGKYEKRALVRLAITNQTFEHSGFVHKDNNGEMYFTYPGDDVLNYVLGNTAFRLLGIPGAQPMSSNFGGKVKMLTPSLDPESAALRLSGPFIGLSTTVLENIPGIGAWVRSAGPVLTGASPDQEWWRKTTPINIQRLIDLGIKNDKTMMTEQKYSAAVQAMRLLISTGNGPTTGADINPFTTNAIIQATNIMALRFVTGLGAPASVQMFATKDVPKEMIDAGYFTWDSEFAKILSRYANDDHAFEKAFVQFATLYPSKTVYAVAKTTAGTEASFAKTYEAAQFVKNNSELIKNNKQAAAFFIPINGTSDIEAYTYLKSQGLVKNKDLEDFLREASTADARQQYNTRKDLYDQTILATADSGKRRYLREQWKVESDFFKKAYPLLAKQISPDGAYLALKKEALDDLRNVVYSGKSPDKKLADVFAAMIVQYDQGTAQINGVTGRTDYDSGYKKAIREDLKDVLRQIAGDNPNAKSLYWNLFEPLIGE
jgi:hypothetical protein